MSSSQNLYPAEQDEVIQNLREQNAGSQRQYLVFIRVLVLLSAVLCVSYLYLPELTGNPLENRQFIHLLTPTKVNPLLVIFPEETPSAASTIPLATVFTLLSLFVHLNLALLFHPDEVRTFLKLTHNPKPLSYSLLYALSAVAPTLSLFLRLPWQTTLWWLLTALIVFVVQTVIDAIESGTQSISELESKRYVARGA